MGKVPVSLRSSGETCHQSMKIDGVFFDFRVEEMNWRQWRTDVGHIQEEDPGDRMMKPQPPEQTPGKPYTQLVFVVCTAKMSPVLRNHVVSGNRWNLSPLLERLRGRRRHPQPSITSRSLQPGLPF